VYIIAFHGNGEEERKVALAAGHIKHTVIKRGVDFDLTKLVDGMRNLHREDFQNAPFARQL